MVQKNLHGYGWTKELGAFYGMDKIQEGRGMASWGVLRSSLDTCSRKRAAELARREAEALY